ncbi:hypothetical protein [Arthrobacter sp. B0490]|uniref:hypothetical protein n=1 Tax=Arthrobacter sp. B0490 TaxID=2058891 RepID=UPI000CE4BBFF|nr:hypothetical protein [Arthrobacter sp. B0490]
MTEQSSAGNPDGAALPADHPLGPAEPVPPREKKARRAGQDARHDDGTGAPQDARHDDGTGAAAGGPGGADAATERDGGGHADDGHPDADRREGVLDPSAGSRGHRADSIRDEQGTHEAGAVPAAFDGDGAPAGPGNRHPEDAAAEPDTWDSGGSGR